MAPGWPGPELVWWDVSCFPSLGSTYSLPSHHSHLWIHLISKAQLLPNCMVWVTSAWHHSRWKQKLATGLYVKICTAHSLSKLTLHFSELSSLLSHPPDKKSTFGSVTPSYVFGTEIHYKVSFIKIRDYSSIQSDYSILFFIFKAKKPNLNAYHCTGTITSNCSR